MNRTAVIVAAALALALALAATPALAQPRASDFKRLGVGVRDETKRVEVLPYRSMVASIIAGYDTDVAGFGELRVGYGFGTYRRSLLLPSVSMHRLSAAVRGSYGRADSYGGSLLYGIGYMKLLGFTLDVGADTRLGPGDTSFGIVASIGGRAGPFGLHLTMANHMVGDADFTSLTIGLGYTMKDWKSPADVAKERATEEAEAHGIPIP